MRLRDFYPLLPPGLDKYNTLVVYPNSWARCGPVDDLLRLPQVAGNLPLPLSLANLLSDPSKPDSLASDSSWKKTVDCSVRSDIGMRRSINQDSYAVHLAETEQRWKSHGHLLVVADGMGAHAAGELASKLASELIPHQYLRTQDTPPAEALYKSITESNAEIYRRGQANIEFRSMGTTCSVLSLLPEGALVAHVGDSRVYQVHGDQIYQLTFDHSLVWEMQAAGELTEETARSGAIPKNVITRSLGPNAGVQVDLEGPYPIRQGDCFLLCSDGLSGQVSDEELAIIMKALPPDEASQLMIDLSNLRGGPDNITATIVRVVDSAICSPADSKASLRRSGPRRKFSPALAIVSTVCFCAAVLLALTNNTPLAIVTGTLGLVSLATGLIQVSIGARTASSGSNYGNGPYRQYSMRDATHLCSQMDGTVQSLREAAEEQGWAIEWKTLDDQLAKAKDLTAANKHVAAVATAGRVVIELMKQIRKQRGSNASDSAVDL